MATTGVAGVLLITLCVLLQHSGAWDFRAEKTIIHDGWQAKRLPSRFPSPGRDAARDIERCLRMTDASNSKIQVRDLNFYYANSTR